MDITYNMKTDLIWWITYIAVQGRNIFRPGTEINLHTDASNLGWGGYLNHQQINGRWSIKEKTSHQFKRTQSHLLAVKLLAHHIRGKHIKVFCDNTTPVNYVN